MREFGIAEEFLEIASELTHVAYGNASDTDENYYGFTRVSWQKHLERHPEHFDSEIDAHSLLESPSLWTVRCDMLEAIMRTRFEKLGGTELMYHARVELFQLDTGTSVLTYRILRVQMRNGMACTSTWTEKSLQSRRT
jgi:hypothetical protein